MTIQQQIEMAVLLLGILAILLTLARFHLLACIVAIGVAICHSVILSRISDSGFLYQITAVVWLFNSFINYRIYDKKKKKVNDQTLRNNNKASEGNK